MEPHNAYSSSGPTYEQVANGNQQDHTYSILERDENTNRRSNQLNPIDEEQNYHVVESGRCEGVMGAGCDSVYTVRLVTTKCQCQAKQTARCGCVKRTTPHSGIENTEYCVSYCIIRHVTQNFSLIETLQFLCVYLCIFIYNFSNQILV